MRGRRGRKEGAFLRGARAAAGPGGEAGGARAPPRTQEDLDGVVDAVLGLQGAERAKHVAEQWRNFGADFFLHVAARSDAADDAAEKKALADLSSDVMRILETLVKKADERMDGSAETLQKILAAAADANGEFDLPLADDKVEAMATAMDQVLPQGSSDDATEGVLGHAFGYMKKANEDGLDGMVALIQSVLQVWAAREVRAGTGADSALARVADAKPEAWADLLGEDERGGFEKELRGAMEAAVLERANGSFQQRVLAEYLKEMEERTVGANTAKE